MTHPRMTLSGLAAAILCAMLPSPSFAAKTDVVLLVNGNSITGEIKSLDFGALKYSTDSMGTVSIDWEDVVSATTTQTLQVEVSDGTRYFGALNSVDHRYHVKVMTASREVTLTTAEIVRMTPIDHDESFLSSLEGSFSLGLDSEKASEVTTFNLATDVQYRTLQYLVELSANASITNQPSEPTSQRSTIGLNYQRFRDNRWFTDWFVNWETNQQLGIQNRYIAGGGLGRYLVQNNRNQFSLAAGLNATYEEYVDATEASTEAEGRIRVRYLHRSLLPEAYVSLTTNYYPLLANLSRYRLESDLSIRREFIEDLFFDVTLFHSYLSDPPSGSESQDYGITTSLGYSW